MCVRVVVVCWLLELICVKLFFFFFLLFFFFLFEQIFTQVRPMHIEFVEPSKRHADVIIPEGGHNKVRVHFLFFFSVFVFFTASNLTHMMSLSLLHMEIFFSLSLYIYYNNNWYLCLFIIRLHWIWSFQEFKKILHQEVLLLMVLGVHFVVLQRQR